MSLCKKIESIRGARRSAETAVFATLFNPANYARMHGPVAIFHVCFAAIIRSTHLMCYFFGMYNLYMPVFM